MTEMIIQQLRRLNVTKTEMVALKAIMALDHNVKGLSAESCELLVVARESVQNALFSHLIATFGTAEATSRFAHLLLLIASATVIESRSKDQLSHHLLFSEGRLLALLVLPAQQRRQL